jgi:hypothetical protein
MLTHHETDDRVLEVIVRSPDRMLDEVALECPDLTWNQVFIAIDRLSREGTLSLTPKGRGLYTVRLSNQALHEAGQLAHG